jgi:hypothetical protein
MTFPLSNTTERPMTLVWEPGSTLDASASLAWDPQDCHRIVSQAFPNPQYCVTCFLQDQSLVRHLDQAQRRTACPLYSLDYQGWHTFQLGWQVMQKKGATAFREDMVDIERYAYCGGCLIEICQVTTHECVFASHDREGCARRQDHDNRWFVRLTFLILRQSLVRNQIAKALTAEDTSSWDAYRWGGWVSCPYTSHLSRASVVISLYLQHLRK